MDLNTEIIRFHSENNLLNVLGKKFSMKYSKPHITEITSFKIASLEYYQNIELSNRSDQNEGVAAHIIQVKENKEVTVRQTCNSRAHLISCWTLKNDANIPLLAREFKASFAIVSTIGKIEELLKSKFNLQEDELHHDRICYRNENEPFEKAKSASFCKNDSFTEQKEYRFEITLNLGFEIRELVFYTPNDYIDEVCFFKKISLT